MKEKFRAKDFDKVSFINSGNETEELFEAKEYLKDIQMSVNIGDLNESLLCIEDIKNVNDKEEILVFNIFKESIFSNYSLSFLEKVKYLTSFQGINSKQLEESNFSDTDNFAYLDNNLSKHCTEFITAIWDCILLIKISEAKGEKSLLVDCFNDFFSNLTQSKTGNANAYIKKEESFDMICELVLFMQFYIPDFFIYLIKSNANISSKKDLEKTNKEFVEILKKSKKIEHRLEMLAQIKSNNYQLLLKLLIDQKHSELKNSK